MDLDIVKNLSALISLLYYDLQNEVSPDRGPFTGLDYLPQNSPYFEMWLMGEGRNPNDGKTYLIAHCSDSLFQNAFDNSESFDSYGNWGGGGGEES